MDPRAVAQVVRNHWIIAILGLILAIALGAAAFVFRGAQEYTSSATLFVTQEGFPFTNSNDPFAANPVSSGGLASFAYLYAQIATSDAILNEANVPVDSIAATVRTTGAFNSGSPLPFIDITASGTSPADTQRRANAVASALQAYVARGERAAKTPPDGRLLLRKVTAPVPGKPVSSTTRSTILPGIVFLTMILVTLGLIFALEGSSASTGTADRFIAQPTAGEPTSPAWSRSPIEPEPAATQDVARSSQGGSWRRSAK